MTRSREPSYAMVCPTALGGLTTGALFVHVFALESYANAAPAREEGAPTGLRGVHALSSKSYAQVPYSPNKIVRFARASYAILGPYIGGGCVVGFMRLHWFDARS